MAGVTNSVNTGTDMVINRLGKENIVQAMRALDLQEIYLPLTIRQIFESILPSADSTQDPYELEKRIYELDSAFGHTARAIFDDYSP